MDGLATAMVTPNHLKVYYAWFGRLQNSVESVRRLLLNMKNVISIQWFHGFITRKQAEERLKGQRQGGNIWCDLH